MLQFLKTESLLNISKTIAKEIFKASIYPWEVLSDVSDFILKLGKSLSSDKYIFYKENIWVAKNSKISDMASIVGPAIIDEEAIIRPGSYIRQNVVIGKRVVVGNSTELKNSILFDEVEVPHYNYVGDSILGHKSHLGAGVVLSNLKSDRSKIVIKSDFKIETNLKKFGAIIGDFAEIGCNSVLNPGTILGKNSTIYPLCSVRGYVPENHIFKNYNNLVKKYVR